MRNELVSIKEAELEKVKEALKREYANLLVLVVKKDTTSDIYLVNEQEEKKDPYLFCSLEDVVDYKYDPANIPTIIAKIVSKKNDGVYWLAFAVGAMIRKCPNEVYKPRPFSFLTISKCNWDSEAEFLKGYEYLDDCKMAKINGQNYILKYGNYSDVGDISPMFWRCILEKGCDGKQRIQQIVTYTETLFGPFDSIEAWKEGTYPYIDKSFHGYFGKDQNGYILAMTVICDWFKLREEKSPVYFEDTTRTEYEYNIKFEKPLKAIRFIQRDFERTDSKTKYTATDVWRLEYADGTRAIMFNSIGRKDYPKHDRKWSFEEKQRVYDPAESKFKCFTISEDYIKGIFDSK